MLYTLLSNLLRGAVGVFFREVHLVGQDLVPEQGGVVFAGNHPNSLIDPVLVIATGGRVVHFAAKDKLFAWPLGPVLKGLGCVPIARRMDHGDAPGRDNNAALDALAATVAHGGAVGIFPEGLSHDQPQLARLRSGAARVALAARADHPERPACIVPTGLTYVHKRHFRSQVLVRYGEPIEIDDTLVALWQQDPHQAARALTDRIEERLRELTINAPDWETLRVLHAVRRLYQPRQVPMHLRVELARRFCALYPTVADRPDVRQLYQDVQAFLRRLSDAGLNDRDLLRGADPRVLRRALANVLTVTLWLPLALPGALVHAPLLLLVGWAGLRFAPRKDVIGTSRLISGAIGVALLYVALPVAAGIMWGLLPALVIALLLPLSGLATLRVLERGTSLRRILRSARKGLVLRRVVQELREERERLEGRVVDAVERYRPAELEALFPRAAEPA